MVALIANWRQALERYEICMAGLQETKWFGKDVWPTADGCTFLHPGRSLPERNEVARVGILLNNVA